jgi:hypothetical protein
MISFCIKPASSDKPSPDILSDGRSCEGFRQNIMNATVRSCFAFISLRVSIALTCLLFLRGGASAEIWSQAPTGIFYDQGNVGIGIGTPQSRLHISGTPAVVRLTGANPFFLLEDKSNGLFSRIQANGGGLTFQADRPDGGSGSIRLLDTGFVGIGTATPKSLLHISGNPDALRLTGSKPFITLEDADAGLYSRIEADGAGLNLKTEGAATGSNPGGLIHLDGNGYLGVGTRTPDHQLSIKSFAGGPSWTSNHWGGAISLDNGTAIGWQTNNAGQRFGIGHTNGGLFMFRTASNPGTGASPATYDFVLNDDGKVGIGTITPEAKLDVVGNTRTSVLTITGGVDLAEPFHMKEDELEKGSVVVIDDEYPGRLKRSTHAYDRHVAGIVSGANGINPGISLHQEGVVEGGQNVALSGRVYVEADVSGGAIEPGDLLTTSDVPGHAMKAADYVRAQGAILGKAMGSLRSGQGMLLVLVTLQ